MLNEMLNTLLSNNMTTAETYGARVISGSEELPEIPADVLASYPYALLFDGELTTDGVTNTSILLIASTSEWCYDGDENYLITTGAVHEEVYQNGDWVDASAGIEEALLQYIDLSHETMHVTLLSSTHDIYFAENADYTAGTYTKTDRLYYSVNDGEVEYKFKHSTIRGLADEARRLGNVEGELTTAQMKEIFRLVEKGRTYPIAEENKFGGEEENTEYVIQGDTLTNIAVAIQTKKDTTAVFSPEQMATEIDGIVIGDNLPNAEDALFGVEIVAYEEGATFGSQQGNLSMNGDYGYEFTVKNDSVIYGFRVYGGSSKTYSLKLWDKTSGTVIAQHDATLTGDWSWKQFILDSPVNVFAGQTYAVTRYGSPVLKAGYCDVASARITKNRYCYNANDGSYPSYTDTTINPVAMVDILIGDQLTASEITEYKIQTRTVNAISEQVQRITGTTNKLTTAQIITALQGIEAVTTE